MQRRKEDGEEKNALASEVLTASSKTEQKNAAEDSGEENHEHTRPYPFPLRLPTSGVRENFAENVTSIPFNITSSQQQPLEAISKTRPPFGLWQSFSSTGEKAAEKNRGDQSCENTANTFPDKESHKNPANRIMAKTSIFTNQTTGTSQEKRGCANEDKSMLALLSDSLAKEELWEKHSADKAEKSAVPLWAQNARAEEGEAEPNSKKLAQKLREMESRILRSYEKSEEDKNTIAMLQLGISETKAELDASKKELKRAQAEKESVSRDLEVQKSMFEMAEENSRKIESLKEAHYLEKEELYKRLLEKESARNGDLIEAIGALKERVAVEIELSKWKERYHKLETEHATRARENFSTVAARPVQADTQKTHRQGAAEVKDEERAEKPAQQDVGVAPKAAQGSRGEKREATDALKSAQGVAQDGAKAKEAGGAVQVGNAVDGADERKTAGVEEGVSGNNEKAQVTSHNRAEKEVYARNADINAKNGSKRLAFCVIVGKQVWSEEEKSYRNKRRIWADMVGIPEMKNMIFAPITRRITVVAILNKYLYDVEKFGVKLQDAGIDCKLYVGVDPFGVCDFLCVREEQTLKHVKAAAHLVLENEKIRYTLLASAARKIAESATAKEVLDRMNIQTSRNRSGEAWKGHSDVQAPGTL